MWAVKQAYENVHYMHRETHLWDITFFGPFDVNDTSPRDSDAFIWLMLFSAARVRSINLMLKTAIGLSILGTRWWLSANGENPIQRVSHVLREPASMVGQSWQ